MIVLNRTFLQYVLLPAVMLALQLMLPAKQAQAQRWLQTVEVIVPIGEDDITSTLLDTLVHVFQERKVSLARTPGGARRPFSVIEDSLLSRGVDFTSANQVFISYRFEADQRGLKSTIENMFFIYRPTDFEQQDIPLFYIDTTEPEYRSVLLTKGTSLPNNEAVFLPFMDQLMIHRLPESTVTMVGNRVIRNPGEADAEKRRLLTTIRRFVY